MANWSNPTLLSTYTNFLSELKARDEDLAKQFDGTTSSNLATGTIRWNSTTNRWQKWSGSAWAELTGTYALTDLTTTGNASIGGTLAVTGATTLAAATATTPATGNNSTAVATTAYVRAQAYAPLASPALTGTPAAPTAAAGTNTTQLATTAFVNAEIANDAPTKTGTGASGTWGISVTGNAGTATTLQTARTLTIGSTGKTFNGSANVSWTAAEILLSPVSGNWFRGYLGSDSNGVTELGRYLDFHATNTSVNDRDARLECTGVGAFNFNGATVTAGTFVGALTGTASGNLVSGGALGTPSSGNLANCTSINATNISSGTLAEARLPFQPIQQGGGTGQGNNKTYIGWLGTQLGLQVDNTNFGATWPISVSGNAATATNCSRSVLAGNGMTEGGALSGNVTLALGTPGSLTGATGNTVTPTSHTHEVTVNLGVTGGTTAGPVITSSAGTNATIPSASGSSSGVVTTNAQSFNGAKTFLGGIIIGTALNPEDVSAFGSVTIEAGTAGDGALYLEASATTAGQVRSLTIFNNTTASTGNEVRVASTGTLQRISSSIKYKKDVELLEDQYADAIIDNARPTWYRSKCEADNPDWGHYGFIAEELVQIDPRLVCLTPDKDGSYLHSDGERYEPEGVQYQSFVPLLVNVIQRQRKTIKDMQTSLAAIETRIAALEA